LPFHGPKKSRFQGPPLQRALVMDFPPSKSILPAPYKQTGIGVIHCVFDKILSLQNCFTTSNTPRRGGGLRQINTCRQVPLLVNFKKSRHLGFESFGRWSKECPLACLCHVNKERSTHGRRNFKDTNLLMSSLRVVIVWGGVAIL
jgi:hypothetical protein